MSKPVSTFVTFVLVLLSFSSTLVPALAQEARPNPPPRPQPRPQPPAPAPAPIIEEDLDQELAEIILQQGLQAIDASSLATLPVTDPKVQLGKKLFFSKNLGGEQSVACVSCHHPLLGGADELSLPVGVAAVDLNSNIAHNLLGLGRFNGLNNIPVVPRNSPSIFNLALYERGLFWDSRIERLRNGRIATPDSIVDDNNRRRPDENIPQNASLVDAQARFPVTSIEEMRGTFMVAAENSELRQALVSRLNDDIASIASNWPAEFSDVYQQSTIDQNQVFGAIAAYENSMVFVNSPWQRYLQGEQAALTVSQKAGAALFFTPTQQGGAGCIACHNGDNFSNERHHLVGFPQFGTGKGNTGTNGSDQDFGRENITNNAADKYHFRTPGLLNIEVSAPYGHTGAYQTLEEVVAHYVNPRESVLRLFGANDVQPQIAEDSPYCRLPQITRLAQKHQTSCEQLFPNALVNSLEVVDFLEAGRRNDVETRAAFRARVRLSQEQIVQVADFLRALTDPCVKSKECMSPWLLNTEDIANFPDDQALEAVNERGDLL